MTLNVLQICFSNGWGGLEMYPVRLHPFFEKHQVSNYLMVKKDSALEQHLKTKTLYPFTTIDWSLSLIGRIKALINYINQNKITLLHCHKSSDLFYAVIAKYFCPIKVVFTEHMGGKREKKDFYHRWIYRNLDQLFSISNEVKRRNLNALPISSKKISTIHLGINLDYYHEKLSILDKKSLINQWGLPKKGLIIGVPGRLSPSKGHDTLIQAASIIAQKHPFISYVFIGGTAEAEGADLNYISGLKKLIITHNLKEQFHFIGFQENIPNVIECLDIACIPSYNEAFGLTVIETMAMNTPLIASNAGGIPELLTDQTDGLLFTPKDHTQLAEKLLLLIERPKLGQQYAKKAVETVKNKFSQIQHVDKIVKQYHCL